jgi:site-specific DNA-methyltransferase (adenine-specific)
MEWLIKTYSNEGEIVLDNCMGSGSTGVAAVKLNRKFIGMEFEQEYYEIAKQRIEDAMPVEEVAQEPQNPLLEALY